ncbi:GerAB/ArcD/ProY family transporter [Paenibacillus tarimensis]
MNNQEIVSPGQMGVLFFVYMTGSSIINIPNPLIAKAQNGAWLSLLISGGAGLLLLACVLYLYRRYPELTFVQYSNKLIGVWPTAVIAALPISFMLHMSTGIALDIGLFMRSSMLRETPIYAFSFLTLLVAALTVRAGVEVMARMFLLIMIPVVLFVGFVLLLAMKDYDPSLLFPVMPQGIKPVLNGAFFSYGFPYAEVFLFAMLLPFSRKSDTVKVNRIMVVTLTANIVVLCISTVCTIMVFGPMAGMKKYSLYELARTIEVQEIITRIESMIGLSLIAGSYMKSTITLYVLSIFVSHLFRLKNERAIALPLALVIFLNTLVGFDSDMQWVEMVSIVHPVWVTFAYVLPLLLVTAAALFRKPSGQGKREGSVTSEESENL